MPAYNTAVFLGQALDSIFCQTYRDFEVVVVDDGSVDNTRAVLCRYGDARLRVLTHRTNRGLSRSLNDALDAARGEYIVRMDADDTSLPGRLHSQVAFLDAHPDVGVVGARVQPMDEAGRNRGEAQTVPLNSGHIRYLLPFTNCINHPTVAARREVLESCGGYDPAAYPADDYDLWLRVAERSDLANQDEVLVRYRQHGASVTTWWSSVGGGLDAEESVAHRSVERLLGHTVPFPAFVRARRTVRGATPPTSAAEAREAIAVVQQVQLVTHRGPLDDEALALIRADVAIRYARLGLSCLQHNPWQFASFIRTAPIPTAALVAAIGRRAGRRVFRELRRF